MSRCKSPLHCVARLVRRLMFGRGSVANEGHISGPVESVEHCGDHSYVRLGQGLSLTSKPRIRVSRLDGLALEEHSEDWPEVWVRMKVRLAGDELECSRWMELPFQRDPRGENHLCLGGVVKQVDWLRHELRVEFWHGLRRRSIRIFLRDFHERPIAEGQRGHFEVEVEEARGRRSSVEEDSRRSVALVVHTTRRLKPLRR